MSNTITAPDPPTVVLFRRWKAAPRTVVAVFPLIPADCYGALCDSYEHIGQHAACNWPGIAPLTTPVPLPLTDPEALALADELRSIGYTLAHRRRAPAGHRGIRYRALRDYLVAAAEADSDAPAATEADR